MNSGTVFAGTDGVHLHDEGNPANARHRRGVAEKTETKIIVERRVDGIRRHREKQQVPVRGRAHDSFRADIAAGTWPVVDDELLAQPLRQPLTQHACDDVGRAAGRNLNDQAHRPRRIRLRPGGTRKRRKHGGAHCPMQEFAAGRFHGVPFPICSRRGHATRGRVEHGRRDAHEPSISNFSERLSADDMSAAAQSQDFGMSPWQLGNKATIPALGAEGVRSDAKRCKANVSW